MRGKHQQFVDDAVTRRAIAELERQGFKVRGGSARETIKNIKRVLDENTALASGLASSRTRSMVARKSASPARKEDR